MKQYYKYIVFDAARMEDKIEKAKELCPEFFSLYRGEKENQLASVAPYIFDVTNNPEIQSWYFTEGYDKSWGIICFSLKNLKQIRKHFRRFLIVVNEEKEELLFRFYDPRVFRVFLPTCDNIQLKDFFGPIDQFICEDENSGLGLVFSLEENQLITKSISKEEIEKLNPEVNKKRFWWF